ncbi:hypothetical protein IMG5_123670 [Ichthyophthirius multifiliis]|uniref:AMP-dependent synthetase/ligase domain-containing protein n=1 Tax=Ichthyophthirius multifiliis TaxID=5932 RepID=G0QVH0_ICHMU|nr:hypothetical protein IMG5_123670 [Ichthyophthirius multifiliis]EGR30780.1 hypothetical protein IMG5_123670 [Ichthyophthirius multifiliis]|eukprot:XP_004032367.1 hypothetical protein IMG5_123670 [Ichthyophthirius multifiliis]
MKLFQRLNKFNFSSISESPLQRQLLVNKNKNAVRFENQNKTWTYQEIETHSNAFAYGLTELGWKQGDKLLLWVEKNHTSEIVCAQLGAAKTGVVLIPLYAQNEQELESAINESNANGILLSPNSKGQQDKKYIDIINSVIPELQRTSNGGALKSRFSQLRHVFHTGFYTFQGTFKYRQLLVYASKNFNTLSLPKVDLNATLFLSNNKSYNLKELISQSEGANKESNLSEKN